MTGNLQVNVEALVEQTVREINAQAPSTPIPQQLVVDYTEDDILTKRGLRVVRQNPMKYVRDREVEGQNHIAQEILDNALDELIACMRMTGRIGSTTVTMCIDPGKQTYTLIISDTGRGIPIAKLIPVFTEPNTSGKFNTRIYMTSAGQFGEGSKGSAGLSDKFRAITRTPQGIGSCLIVRADHGNTPEVMNTVWPVTGTTVIMTPDPTIFTGIEDFIRSGYYKTVELIQKYCYFQPFDLQFKVIQEPWPEVGWTMPADQALRLTEAMAAEAAVVFDPASFDRLSWLRRYLDVVKPFVWQDTLVGEGTVKVTEENDAGVRETTDRYLGFDVQLYYAKGEPGGRFGMVNNIGLDDPRHDHLSSVTRTLAQALVRRIEDEKIAAFFMSQYKLPIYMAVNINYQGARFTGTTKHAFYSVEFREGYSAMLAVRFAEESHRIALDALYEVLKDDIEAKYQATLQTATKTIANKRIHQLLKWPERWFDCDPPGGNRRGTELFLMEGGSAGGGKGRDKQTQGIYAMGGKPYNGIESVAGDGVTSRMIEAVTKKDVYKDILTILNYNVNRPDLSALNYERCIVTTDGDAHGRHIAAIFIGNMSAIAPDLVNSGFFHVVAPPYYELTFGSTMKKGKDTTRVYLRDVHDVAIWMTRVVYRHGIDIHIEAPDAFSTPRRLSDAEFDGFFRMILHVGERIARIGASYRIPPMVVESLTWITQYLEPGKIDEKSIAETLGFDHVSYEEHGHILTLGIGKDDYIIPLHNVRERLYEEVIPHLQRMGWRRMVYLVSTVHTDLYKKTPMCISQIYALCQEMNSMFHIRNFKGLGNMEPEDKYRTCMDPRHRVTYPIRSVGDVSRIFDLLGADSAPRKDLISARTL